MNGSQSTQMIRKFEQSLAQSLEPSPRVPIIAVSASLTEANRYAYANTGFDGWILKPIDFTRLDLLLRGIKMPELRRDAVYMPGYWEKGGWFMA